MQLRIILPWRGPSDIRRAIATLGAARKLGLVAKLIPCTRTCESVPVNVEWNGPDELYKAHAVVIAANRSFLRSGNFPPLYASGVRYAPEPPGMEDWVTIPVLFERKEGDCDDIAGARVAELREAGELAAPHFKRTRKGYHVQVRRASGRIEDPSARLGMGRGR